MASFQQRRCTRFGLVWHPNLQKRREMLPLPLWSLRFYSGDTPNLRINDNSVGTEWKLLRGLAQPMATIHLLQHHSIHSHPASLSRPSYVSLCMLEECIVRYVSASDKTVCFLNTEAGLRYITWLSRYAQATHRQTILASQHPLSSSAIDY